MTLPNIFHPAPKLCRLQYRYTKNKALGCTARGDACVKITCGNLLALLAAPEKTDGEQWQPGTASVMAQYKKMILASNGQKKKKKKATPANNLQSKKKKN